MLVHITLQMNLQTAVQLFQTIFLRDVQKVAENPVVNLPVKHVHLLQVMHVHLLQVMPAAQAHLQIQQPVQQAISAVFSQMDFS